VKTRLRLHEKIAAYHKEVAGDPHHRYRSWEHCYQFFKRQNGTKIIQEPDTAALQLAFCLASWGMYRGSSFLLQHSYTVHLGVIERLVPPQFSVLWGKDLGGDVKDKRFIPVVLAAAEAIREGYEPFGKPTDTLVTKVLLGTLGCLPACDRLFIAGFKKAGFNYSSLNAPFVERVLDFCNDNVAELRKEQARIEAAGSLRYPLMKLVDMYFWQIGRDADRRSGGLRA
jgi:hypothetical protein